MRKNDSNFKKAVNELLNMDGGNAAGRDEAEQEKQFLVEEAPETASEEASVQDSAVSARPGSVLPAGGRLMSDILAGETVITRDVIIEGNIISGSNLKILGTVQGNVSCEGTVVLSGTIEGGITAGSLKFQSGSVDGDIRVREDMTADKETRVKGNVEAAGVIFGGSAEGNFDVHNTLELRETAAVVGNIKADGIVMYNGSRVKGMLDIGGEVENMGRNRGE